MKLNSDKTEFCIFSRNKDPPNQIHLKIDNKEIKRNDAPKLLGVILDRELTFKNHIEYVEEKCNRNLSYLITVTKSEKISVKNTVNLYNSMVLPQLEYAVPVWQIANCQSLEKIQRKGISLCLGLPTTVSKDAVEVLTGVLPLDLRREELSIRECGKIFAKDRSQNIASCLSQYIETHTDLHEKTMSPFGKMLTQVEDMKSLTDITLNSTEPEFSYFEYMQQTRTRPDYWNNLGSSKNRTKEQETEARVHINNIRTAVDNTTAVAFTDGSCMGNPGPCGAGACILLPNTELLEVKQPVSKYSSILVGELVAIKITLENIIEESDKCNLKKLIILCDSQSAVGIVQLGWENKSHKHISREILQLWKELENRGIDIHLDWTPGHAGISGNETADRLAKEAASDAQTMPDNEQVTSQSDIKRAALDSVRIKWQRRWEIAEGGRHLFQYRNKVKPKHISFECHSINQRIMLQLQSGYCLHAYLHKVGIKDTPFCSCGAPETVSHYIADCPLHEATRD